MTDEPGNSAGDLTLGRRAFVLATGTLIGSAALGGVAHGARPRSAVRLTLAQQLAAHWSFDEGKGITTVDRVTGQADPISYVFTDAIYKPNSDPLWEPATPDAGKLSGALLFDGYSTYVTRDAVELGTEALSVEAWVAARGFEWGDGDKESAIVNQQEADANLGFSLGAGRHGRWSFGVGTGDAWYQATVEQSAALKPDQWAHVAGSFDPAAGVIRLYLNGREVASAPVPTEARFAPAGVPLLIGQHNQPRSSTASSR